MAAAEWTESASPAKHHVPLHRAELVVRELVGAGEQAKRFGLDDDPPPARLGADRAVALAGPGRQVDLGLEANVAAVAASGIGLGHGRIS